MTTACRFARPEDVDFFQRELDAFVPGRVFDAHCHLWNPRPATWDGIPDQAGYRDYLELMEDLHPGRKMAAMFIPPPSRTDADTVAAANAWTAEQVAAAGPPFRGSFFIRPQDDPEWVRQEVRRLKLHGLKCYHTFVPVKPTWEATIPDYLPERIVQVAHEEGWFITLHMVRSRAVADPDNIQDRKSVV